MEPSIEFFDSLSSEMTPYLISLAAFLQRKIKRKERHHFIDLDYEVRSATS